MENLGAMADLRCTGFHELTDSDVLDLYCSYGQGYVSFSHYLLYFTYFYQKTIFDISCNCLCWR